MLRNSKVQTFLVQKVAAYLSNELETRVEVGKLDVSFFLNIVLLDVIVDDQKGNPLLHSERMVLDINRISFRKRDLVVNNLYLENASLQLNRSEGQDHFNAQFLFDYFMERDNNRTRSEARWDVVCRSFELSNFRFAFNDFTREPLQKGFDPYHISVDHFGLAISDIFFDPTNLRFTVEYFSFVDSRQMGIHHLSGFFSVDTGELLANDLLIHTANSSLSLDMSLVYDDYSAFQDFFNLVDVSLQLNYSEVDLSDMGYYFPGLYGMDGTIIIEGGISGKPSDLWGDDLSLAYGTNTRFLGSFHVSGLPDADQTHVNFVIDELQTSAQDLSGFRLPAFMATTHANLPENMERLQVVSYQGHISGYLHDLFAKGELHTGLGNIYTTLSLARDRERATLSYKGQIGTEGFYLGRFMDNEDVLGAVSLDLDIEGKGMTIETAELMIRGNIDRLEFSGYGYENLEISGEVSNRMFNGALRIDDPNIFLDFLGVISFEEDIPFYNFQAIVESANVTALNLYQRVPDAESIISAVLNINATGASIDDLAGRLTIDDVFYKEHWLTEVNQRDSIVIYNTQTISLQNRRLSDSKNHLLFESEFAEARLYGEVTFFDLLPSVKQFLSVYLPALFQNDLPALTAQHPRPPKTANRQQFEFEILFHNTDLLSDLFFPKVRLSPDSYMAVVFDSHDNRFDIHSQSGLFSLHGLRFTDLNMHGTLSASGYQIIKQSATLMLSDSLIVDNFCLDALIYNDTLLYQTSWSSWDPSVDNHGNLQGILRFVDDNFFVMRFLPSYAMVNNSKWNINVDNEIFFDSARIEVRNLVFYNHDQLLKLEGVISEDPAQRMVAHFNHFDFSNIEAIVNVANMNFDGIMSGMLSFTAIFQQPSFEASLLVNDFAYNHVLLGDLTLGSLWDDTAQGFHVKVQIDSPDQVDGISPLIADGYFYPNRDDDNFDISIALHELPLSLWSRYLDNFAQGFDGLASGMLRFEGPKSNPGLSGQVWGDHTRFRVDYLNTSYSFSNHVSLGHDNFSFENLMLVDPLGNTGIATGTIWHNGFSDFSMDITILPERMLVLNTNASHNNLYYGRAYASGLLHIHGTEQNIYMDVTARANRGTQMFLPLTYRGQVAESHFITFVSGGETTLASTDQRVPVLSGITMNFDLEVTPDAEVQLIFDSQIGDIIRGRGSGDLKLEITSSGAFNMYGEYVIQEGDYLFTLQNLINKRFRIEQGGSIRWTGDPNDADVDLRAAYRLRTSLFDLMMDVDTSDFYRRRVPVECILILEDKLFNPAISFDIHIPGGDESIRELIERRITTEQEMNRQVFSLLVLNRFMPATTDQYNSALGYGVGSTSSELLSNQLSNWLSQISSEFDIGVNYRPGDQISSQELEVALSTQLFDNRVLIDGNVGVAGSNPLASQHSSSIIGDVNVEVKITPEGKFRIKAFNRSNTFDILNVTSPYTQGLGVFYRKEFDSVSELFRRSVRHEMVPDAVE